MLTALTKYPVLYVNGGSFILYVTMATVRDDKLGHVKTTCELNTNVILISFYHLLKY